MTDEQYRELRRMMADMAMRIEELHLAAKRREALSDHRFSLLYEWCAPAEWKAVADADPIDLPDDLIRTLQPHEQRNGS